jgi:nucleoid DNA-binding protein
MTKRDLAERVYRVHGGMSRREATEVVDAILRSMKSRLGSGQRLQVRGFGVFQVIRRKARRGRNPRTGESINLPSRPVLQFRPSGRLLSALNEPCPSGPFPGEDQADDS